MLKYMTPALYLQMQQIDLEDDLDDKWEDNIIKYRKELAESIFPDSVKAFLDKVCLHDADLVASDKLGTCRQAIFPITQEDSSLTLILEQRDCRVYKYTVHLKFILAGPINFRFHQGLSDQGPTIWLYDEFSNEDGNLMLSVFLNNGLEMEIKFKEFHWFQSEIKEDF